MNCDEARELIGALADGELEPADGRVVEQHVDECAGCRIELAELQALSCRVRAVGQTTLPGALETQVRAALANEEKHVARRVPARYLRRPDRRLLAATHLGTLVTGGALAASVLLATGGPATPGFAEQALATHIGAMLSDEFGTVASADTHTVKPWFAGKLDFSPPVINLAAEGFPLESGRVDYLAGRPVAVLDYARGAHRISLFALPAGEGALPSADETIRGYTVISWQASNFAYAAVSDTDPVALRRFVALLRSRTASPDIPAAQGRRAAETASSK